MILRDKLFYVWGVKEFIQERYQHKGTSMKSIYKYIQQYFPNAIIAINKMYSNLNPSDYYTAKTLTFYKPKYIYEVIADLIPEKEEFNFDLTLKGISSEYQDLNELSSGNIKRIDLIMAILIFAEEFILEPIQNIDMHVSPCELSVNNTYVTFNICHHKNTTTVSITVKDAITLEYIIIN